MCTYLTDIERKVADRDIEVYKIVLEEDSVLRPPYQSGCIYASNHVQSWLETPRPCDALPVLPVHSKPMLVCEVNVGLHSFQNFKDAENVLDADFFTFNHNKSLSFFSSSVGMIFGLKSIMQSELSICNL